KWLLTVLTLALALACREDDDLLENTGGTAPGGSGGSGGATCEYDDWRIAMAGAVHEDAEVPRPGSWCPRDGVEICTDPGWAAGEPRVPASDGGPSFPPGVVSRCVGQAWQTIAGASCEAENENCNVFDDR